MSNIGKIRQEIEKRLQRENEILWNAKKRGTYPSPSCEYNLLTLTSLRDFIDSLSQEKPSLPSNLDEAANTFGFKETHKRLMEGGITRKDEGMFRWQIEKPSRLAQSGWLGKE